SFLNLLPVGEDILGYSFENESQTFNDLPAKFGYRPPAEASQLLGLHGFLIISKPENACEPIMPPPVQDNSSGTFIVLISRLDCNFDIKVLNTSLAWYPMTVSTVDVLKKIDIPSIFIGESSANSLKDEFTYKNEGHIFLVPEFSLPLECYLIFFLIIVGVCIILIAIFMIITFVQDRPRARRNRLGSDQLKKLPGHKFKKGDEYDVCATCLDEFEDGDKLRILLCSHAYHCKYVDPWLTKTKKTCLVCKQKVVPSQVSEHIHLLRHLASVNAKSFGALSESYSNQNTTESSDFEDDDNEDTDSSEAENKVNEHGVVVQLLPNGERDCNIPNTV
uniref:RING-type E3 ubiquitin transferase n=1 Tax=Chinchilla lanigera TaxID=34839 RepID=A0A8C2UKA6_CHILA